MALQTLPALGFMGKLSSASGPGSTAGQAVRASKGPHVAGQAATAEQKPGGGIHGARLRRRPPSTVREGDQPMQVGCDSSQPVHQKGNSDPRQDRDWNRPPRDQASPLDGHERPGEEDNGAGNPKGVERERFAPVAMEGGHRRSGEKAGGARHTREGP